MEEKKRERLKTKALQGAAKEVIDRFGSAVKSILFLLAVKTMKKGPY